MFSDDTRRPQKDCFFASSKALNGAHTTQKDRVQRVSCEECTDLEQHNHDVARQSASTWRVIITHSILHNIRSAARSPLICHANTLYRPSCTHISFLDIPLLILISFSASNSPYMGFIHSFCHNIGSAARLPLIYRIPTTRGYIEHTDTGD